MYAMKKVGADVSDAQVQLNSIWRGLAAEQGFINTIIDTKSNRQDDLPLNVQRLIGVRANMIQLAKLPLDPMLKTETMRDLSVRLAKTPRPLRWNPETRLVNRSDKGIIRTFKGMVSMCMKAFKYSGSLLFRDRYQSTRSTIMGP